MRSKNPTIHNPQSIIFDAFYFFSGEAPFDEWQSIMSYLFKSVNEGRIIKRFFNCLQRFTKVILRFFFLEDWSTQTSCLLRHWSGYLHWTDLLLILRTIYFLIEATFIHSRTFDQQMIYGTLIYSDSGCIIWLPISWNFTECNHVYQLIHDKFAMMPLWNCYSHQQFFFKIWKYAPACWLFLFPFLFLYSFLFLSWLIDVRKVHLWQR